jgi:outer membrane protein assembly factor BamB
LLNPTAGQTVGGRAPIAGRRGVLHNRTDYGDHYNTATALVEQHAGARVRSVAARRIAALAAAVLIVPLTAAEQGRTLPATPLVFGFFTARFAPDGTFTMSGDGWPTFSGTWTLTGGEIELATPSVKACVTPGRYRVEIRETSHVRFDLVADECQPRRMILDRSAWRPSDETIAVPERRIVLTGADRPRALPAAAAATGSWPSFRGRDAVGVASAQNLPDRWDGKTGDNVVWRTPIPGLGHSSPIVWGQRIFVTTAVSSRGQATFRPGLYGDGDASDDRSRQRWTILALDKQTGRVVWERVAHESEPIDVRHVKSTYASATPVTDGRTVVAWFGSHGVHAYDVDGNFRWKVDLGKLNVGAYDIPTFEWGPASSPILWNGLVILQVDTQADSFVIALDVETGKTVWRTSREELPSWGTPTVAAFPSGPELVTNASRFIRGYDPKTGKELWRMGGSSKITAPTPIFSNGLIVVASGRAPERPIFVIKPGARGDLTLKEGMTSSRDVVWSRTGRGSYMPTPLAYDGILYVLANNGVFDAYDLATGAEIYRQRLSHLGSGFSSSPVAADGKIYLSSEDGEMMIVAAGREYRQIATNSMGELLMATPALSDGVMYVRSSTSLFAIARR